MRIWVVLLLLLLVAAGGYLAFFPGAATRTQLDPGSGEETGAEGAEKPVPPQSGDRARLPERAPGATPTVPSTLPVTLVAIGRRDIRLDRFTYRVTRDGSEKAGSKSVVVVEGEAKSGHVLQLREGHYTVAMSHPEYTAPPPARVTITRDSPPLTVQLQMRPLEAVLVLEVLDQADNRRLTRYRATIVTHVDGRPPQTRFEPRPETNPLRIEGASGARLVVTVEAEGYTPAKPVDVTFDGLARKVERQVFLARKVRFTGVELRVHDEAQRPIRRIEVVADVRQPDGRYRNAWRRRKAAADGTFRLPDLLPGHYKLNLRSVDDKGVATLHLGHDFEFDFTGTEHILEPLTLDAAASIRLKITDARGKVAGTDVAIELEHPDGKVRGSLWQPIVDGQPDPSAPLSENHLVRNCAARLYGTLPAGRYVLRLRRRGDDVVTRQLDLVVGKITDVAVQLSR